MARFKSINANQSQARSGPRYDRVVSTRDHHSQDLEGPVSLDVNQRNSLDNAQSTTKKGAESVPRKTVSPKPPDEPRVTTPRLGLDELESGEEEEGMEEGTGEDVEDEIDGDDQRQMDETVSNGAEWPAISMVKSSAPLSPVQDYFDLTYHKRKRQYVMASRTEEYPEWQDLVSVSVCTLKNQQIYAGAYVDIQMQASGEDTAYAKVKDIRVLVPGRWLLLLAWLYVIDGYWYESNHLQILLWDTVNAVLRPDKIALRSHVIYDACCSSKLLWKQEDLQKWQAREHSLRVAIP